MKVGDERDVHNYNEAQSDVTIVEVGDERDVQNEAQSDVDTDDSVVEEYESSEYESDYDNSQLYPPEIPTVLSEDNENLSFNWIGILNDMNE